MIPARPFVIALLLSVSAGGANAADDPDKGLVACVEKARKADAICSKLTDVSNRTQVRPPFRGQE